MSKFPRLPIAIFDRDGVQIGTTDILDPRGPYCEHYNSLKTDGTYAAPAESGTLASKDARGKSSRKRV